MSPHDIKPVPDFRLPLVVAVTGHRDLLESELGPLTERVRWFLQDLIDKYPTHRLTILSPLAEGADMLVAREAIGLSLDLVVPLPKRQEDYLRDFQTDQGRREFSEVLSKASLVFELPQAIPPAPQGMDPDAWTMDYPYAQLGTSLCAHCHILLAIWDGKPSAGMGGTAQVVRFHHENYMPGITPPNLSTLKMLVDDESDLVFHIVCSHRKNGDGPHPDFEPLDWSWFTQDKDEPRTRELPDQHKLIFQRSAEFSEDALRFADQIQAGAYSLQSGSKPEDLPEGIEMIDRLYSIADWLAIHYQRLTLRTLLVTHTLAFFMGLMFILYSDLESWNAFLLAFLAFFLIAAGTQFFAKRGAWQRKYQDYRTLAEGLRVQFYWAAAGIHSPDKWNFTHDAFLQSQSPEFGWIRNVMRVAGLRCDANAGAPAAGLEFVLREWVGDQDRGQLGYFKRKARERIERHRLTERLGRISLITSVCIVLLFVLSGSALPESLTAVLRIVMGGTLLLYAIREGYAFATAVKELIKQYEFMLRIYDNAYRRLSQTDQASEKRQILQALGQSALDEHSDWLLMHRERSLDEGEIWRMGS